MRRTLRAVGFLIYFYGITFLLGLIGIPLRIWAPTRVLAFAKFWSRCTLTGLRLICGTRVQITGRHYLPKTGPALIASQHQSAFDTLIWMVELPRPSYVMKQELAKIPLFGPLLEPAGMIGVDRTGGARALRKLLEAAEKARQEGRTIIIFPEGTRLAPGQSAPLHPGIAAIASKLALPVLPVATNSGHFWQRALLGKYPGTIRIDIGPPIPPETPRENLFAALKSHWENFANSPQPLVDKSVDSKTSTPPKSA